MIAALSNDSKVVTDNNELEYTTTSSSVPGGESKHVFLFLFQLRVKSKSVHLLVLIKPRG